MGTYLSRTPGSAGNRKTWTISFWLKRSKVTSSEQAIFTQRIDSSNRFSFGVSGSGEFNVYNRVGGSTYNATTTALHRDFSAWYHVVYKMDTTQASSSNRQAIYVNGVEASLQTDTVPSQDADTAVNSTSECMWGYWANSWGNTQFLDGYLTECYMIDGQALTPTSFGETDSTTGIWKPKTFSGSYGTNGFKLEFKNSGALGTDTSGQSNNFTATNFATSNQVVDTPSNIFATLNPIAGAYNNNTTIGQGALQSTTGGDNSQYFASMGVTKGKWCWEVKINSGDMAIGLFNKIPHVAIGMGGNDYSVMAQLYYSAGGSSGSVNRYQYNSTNYYNIPAGFGNDDSGTIYQFLLDLDSGTKTWIVRRAGDASTQGSFTLPSGFLNGDFIIPGYSVTSTWPATQQQWNFGNPPHSIASGNSDANGYGNFEYAVPSGYYALCTENLNTYG